MKIENKPKVTIPKKVREAMSLDELYSTGLTTPSIEKLILEKEDFSKPCPSYCDRFCKLPCSSRDLESVDFRQSTRLSQVDVLLILPSLRPNERTKYGKTKMGWSEDDLHLKVLNLCTNEFLPRASIAHRTILKCRPTQSDKVTSTTLKRCSPYIKRQIAEMKPKIIVCLGKESAMGLGLKGPSRGFFHDYEVDGVVIPTLVTIHPRITTMIRQNSSGSFWGTDYLDILRRDFKKVKQVLYGDVVLKPLDVAIKEFCDERLFLVTSVEDARKLRDEIMGLPDRSILAWDSETTSLDPWAENAKTLMYQFTYKRPADGKLISVVVPLWHRCNTLYDANDVFGYMQEILLSTNTQKIGHNLAFDILFAKVVHGLHPKSIAFDTMLLLHSLNSGLQGFYDLKVSTSDLLFRLQLGGYEDRLDIDALKRVAAKALKDANLADEADDAYDEGYPTEVDEYAIF